MTKYKNSDGIELSFTNNDSLSLLVKEVVEEAIKILGEYNRSDLRSAEWSLHRGINFLKDNFDIEEDYPYNVEFGNGRTKEELDTVINISKDTYGVQNVINYVRLKDNLI